MPRCDYCGRENEPIAQCCSGCGTEFPVAVELENQAASTNAVPPPVPEVPTLNGWCGVKILIIYVIAHFLVGLLFGLVMSSVAVLEGKHLENHQERLKFAKTI